MKTKILVVDDEKDILELISYNLRKEGLHITTAANGEDALELLRDGAFALAILDLMLPGMQGTELCRILKSSAGTAELPIIMLTAKGQESDKITGLEMGADDYMTKPFSPRELTARVKAVLRRTRKNMPEEEIITVGNININTGTCMVLKDRKEIKLSATEFRLLLYLARKKGRVFDRDALLDAVWKDESFIDPRTVDVHIRRLREHIEDDPSNPEYIRTRRGIGYYMDGGS